MNIVIKTFFFVSATNKIVHDAVHCPVLDFYTRILVELEHGQAVCRVNDFPDDTL